MSKNSAPKLPSVPPQKDTVKLAKPASGKIAVKVINHYGDEVLKVFKV
jgi:hypothetical protein